VPVFAAQDNKKRALTTEQDRAQLEMQIQSFKQSRGLLCSDITLNDLLVLENGENYWAD